MSNKRVLTNKHYGWYVAPANSVANIAAITETEAAGFTNISDAAKFDGMDFNTKASASDDDRSFADAAGAKTSGDADFGGNFAGYKAKAGDTASSYYQAETLIKPAGSDLIVVAVPVESIATGLVAGTEYNGWHVLSDAPTDVRGASSYSWAANLLPQSEMVARGIIAKVAPVPVTVTVVAGSLTGSVGDIARLKAVTQGKIVTVGATWTSSDPTVATVTEHGIVELVATGTATITATFPGATASTASTVTVS